MKRRTVITAIALLGAATLTLLAWYRVADAPTSVATTSGSAQPLAIPGGVAPIADPHQRVLIEVKPARDARQGEAFISHQRAIRSFRFLAPVPPDNATLLQIEKDYVLLQPEYGPPIRLELADLPDADRRLFTEPTVIEPPEKLPVPVPDDPLHREMLESINEVDAPCAHMKDDEARRRCERTLAEEMAALTAECDTKEPVEAALACYEAIEQQFENRAPIAEEAR